MPSIFIEPTSRTDWTSEQTRNREALWPLLREYLVTQMRNQPACDRFYDAQQSILKLRRVDRSEWQAAVRLPVMHSLGYRFDGPEADFLYRAVYHLLGAATCLNWTYPVGRVDGPAIAKAIDQETWQLVDYLVALGVQPHDLDRLLEYCKQL